MSSIVSAKKAKVEEKSPKKSEKSAEKKRSRKRKASESLDEKGDKKGKPKGQFSSVILSLSHEILTIVCLQKDIEQCLYAKKLDCTHCAGLFTSVLI